jgi:transcription initiation factor TFIID subunit 8
VNIIMWLKVRICGICGITTSLDRPNMSAAPGPLPTAQTFATQPYSTYPQAYSQYSTQQFPSVNYSPQPQGALYSAFQVPYGRKDPTSWIDALSPEELSAVDPEIASRAMNRCISAELKYEGFDAAEPAAIGRLEAEVVHCGSHFCLTHLTVPTVIALVIQDLHRRIHDYANLANRTSPLAGDMLDICQECGLETDGLRLTSELSKLRRRGTLAPYPHSPSNRLLQRIYYYQ